MSLKGSSFFLPHFGKTRLLYGPRQRQDFGPLLATVIVKVLLILAPFSNPPTQLSKNAIYHLIVIYHNSACISQSHVFLISLCPWKTRTMFKPAPAAPERQSKEEAALAMETAKPIMWFGQETHEEPDEMIAGHSHNIDRYIAHKYIYIYNTYIYIYTNMIVYVLYIIEVWYRHV